MVNADMPRQRRAMDGQRRRVKTTEGETGPTPAYQDSGGLVTRRPTLTCQESEGWGTQRQRVKSAYPRLKRGANSSSLLASSSPGPHTSGPAKRGAYAPRCSRFWLPRLTCRREQELMLPVLAFRSLYFKYVDYKIIKISTGYSLG
jgi:hypothetical protein